MPVEVVREGEELDLEELELEETVGGPVGVVVVGVVVGRGGCYFEGGRCGTQ